MVEIRQTTVFREWLENLVDGRAIERIVSCHAIYCRHYTKRPDLPRTA